MEVLDRKFTINAKKIKDGNTVTESEAVLFLAKDNLIVPMLHAYLSLCRRNPVNDAQIKGVELLIARVEKWRSANTSLCKFPDIDTGVEASIVNAENK
jgi:hypothetical protein